MANICRLPSSRCPVPVDTITLTLSSGEKHTCHSSSKITSRASSHQADRSVSVLSQSPTAILSLSLSVCSSSVANSHVSSSIGSRRLEIRSSGSECIVDSAGDHICVEKSVKIRVGRSGITHVSLFAFKEPSNLIASLRSGRRRSSQSWMRLVKELL